MSEPQQPKDNGQKTKEQLATERLERYNQDPKSFIEKKDLLVAARRNVEGNIPIFVGNPTKAELYLIKGKLDYHINKILGMIEAKEVIDSKSPIHLPAGAGQEPAGQKKRF